jgi:hypothetical protein
VIIPGGVLVVSDLAAAVARFVGEGIRRDPSRDSPDLRRLLADLDLASARTSVASVPSTAGPRSWITTREEARRRGVTERTIRRRAAEGQIPGATKESGEWQIPS